MRVLWIMIPADGHLGKRGPIGPNNTQNRQGHSAYQGRPTKSRREKSAGHVAPPMVTLPARNHCDRDAWLRVIASGWSEKRCRVNRPASVPKAPTIANQQC